jgi:D-alanyl-lipoteichoic acid acyltransferase DltB (MBOAT superfamily)
VAWVFFRAPDLPTALAIAAGMGGANGVQLPANFNMPYRATSIRDFWRRWHMTLSRFLRDYLYISLGGNRKGRLRRHINLLITMVLGGLWHGASWNFAIWGAIHGIGLAINHFWREFAGRRGLVIPRVLGWALTMLLVLAAWVPFRADTVEASRAVWTGMLGLSGNAASGMIGLPGMVFLTALIAIALFAPNTQQIFSFVTETTRANRLRWSPSVRWAVAMGCLFGLGVGGSLTKTTYFLYFRF